MDQALETVRRYYDENAAAEWDRLEVSPFEFTLTTWMMDKYIRPGDSILDVGGGPGRYALHWAQKGCAVTLVDLSSGNTALARQKAEQAGVELRIHTRNCLELDALDLGEFDHVFLMGPLYHLQKEADRAAADLDRHAPAGRPEGGHRAAQGAGVVRHGGPAGQVAA